MSTHQLAWFLAARADFDSLSYHEQTLNAWAREAVVWGGAAGLQLGAGALRQMEEYTAIEYGPPKMDMLAVPDLSGAGGASWGLAMLVEQHLLVNAEDADVLDEQNAALAVCQAMAHQWTGALVSLDWWSHTWLVEGFASFFGNLVCDKVRDVIRARSYTVKIKIIATNPCS